MKNNNNNNNNNNKNQWSWDECSCLFFFHKTLKVVDKNKQAVCSYQKKIAIWCNHSAQPWLLDLLYSIYYIIDPMCHKFMTLNCIWFTWKYFSTIQYFQLKKKFGK